MVASTTPASRKHWYSVQKMSQRLPCSNQKLRWLVLTIRPRNYIAKISCVALFVSGGTMGLLVRVEMRSWKMQSSPLSTMSRLYNATILQPVSIEVQNGE